MKRKILVLTTVAAAFSLLAPTFANASSKKESAKTIDVTGQDLSSQMLDSAISQTPEFLDKVQVLKDATDKYKSSMTGRLPVLVKADEQTLSADMEKNIAAKTQPQIADKKSKKAVVITAFPSAWEGRWSGPTIIDQMTFSQALQKAQPQAVTAATGSMHPGRLGYCELIFDANADNATLQKYPMVALKLGPAEAPFNPGAKIGLTSFIGTAPARNALLGDGGVKNSEPLFNRLTQLKPQIIEQDMGERSVTTRRGRQESTELRENVIYYEMVGNDQMYIYIAQINYLANGDFKSKLLIHGVLKRKHDTA